jgi:hypothetical protein
LLTAAGFLVLLAAMWQPTGVMQRLNPAPIDSAQLLLILAAVAWLAKIVGRWTLTAKVAGRVAAA